MPPVTTRTTANWDLKGQEKKKVLAKKKNYLQTLDSMT